VFRHRICREDGGDSGPTFVFGEMPMGSYGSSLHVRSDDARAVIAEIAKSFGAQGYRIADVDRKALERPETRCSCRLLDVAEAENGWVGVLDSDLLGTLTLAQELSARLDTYAICVMVDGSTSWHYELFRKGRPVDGFDSPGAPPLLNLDGIPPEVLEMPDADELAKAIGELSEQVPGIAEMVESLLPPEMRQLHRRIVEGTATAEDAEKFAAWTRQLTEAAVSDFGKPASALPIGLTESAGNGKAASKEALDVHIQHLRPLLHAKADTNQVKEVLLEKATFAQEPLADFLELIGINSFFAQLSLQYLHELTEADLRREGIRLARTIMFRKAQ
jgi:hypothetical protein